MQESITRKNAEIGGLQRDNRLLTNMYRDQRRRRKNATEQYNILQEQYMQLDHSFLSVTEELHDTTFDLRRQKSAMRRISTMFFIQVNGAINGLKIPNITKYECFFCSSFFEKGQIGYNFICCCTEIKLFHQRCIQKYFEAGNTKCLFCRQIIGAKVLSSAELELHLAKYNTNLETLITHRQ